jgi:hypothetical protein
MLRYFAAAFFSSLMVKSLFVTAALVAQLAERSLGKTEVSGSIPDKGSQHFLII